MLGAARAARNVPLVKSRERLAWPSHGAVVSSGDGVLGGVYRRTMAQGADGSVVWPWSFSPLHEPHTRVPAMASRSGPLFFHTLDVLSPVT